MHFIDLMTVHRHDLTFGATIEFSITCVRDIAGRQRDLEKASTINRKIEFRSGFSQRALRDRHLNSTEVRVVCVHIADVWF